MERFRTFHNLTLKKKMLIIISLGIILVGISSSIALKLIMNANNKLLHQSMAISLSYSSNEISNILNSIQTTSSLILSDQIVQNNLSKIQNIRNKDDKLSMNEAVRSIIYSGLHSYLFNNPYISNISIFQKDTTISTTGAYPFLLLPDLKEILTQLALNNNGKISWYTSKADSDIFLTREIREIKNLSLETLGILSIRLDMNRIAADSMNYSKSYQGVHFVLLDNQQIIYSTLPNLDNRAFIKLNSDYTIIDLDGEKYFTVHGKINNVDWDYICLAPYSQTFHSVTAAYTFSFAIILASILLAIIFADYLFRSITEHFALLVRKIKAFQGENGINMEILHTEYDYSVRQDELGIIHRHFDSMAIEIQTLVKDKYVNEILIKDAQLKELETQINPHFLYNILESINWRAKAIGEVQISTMVEALGTLLRATLSKDINALITLETELGFVKSYISIQQIRFEERLNFFLDIDPCLNLTIMPKLSVQPLVENAIHYSLEQNTGECNIYITAVRCMENNTAVISVKNDGSQFEEDLLKKLALKEIIPHGLGIGLLNIDSRIKLTLGSLYGLCLFNEDEFAVASVILPYCDHL